MSKCPGFCPHPHLWNIKPKFLRFNSVANPFGLAAFFISKKETPAREFLKSCADLIAQALVPVIHVFKQNQATVAGKSAFSGEVERVSEVIEQVHGLVYPLETAPHSFAECAAFSFVTYDVPDGFPGAG